MARTTAYSMLQAVGENASLAELYGAVIEAVRKGTLSDFLKSSMYTGNPIAGSVEFKRFVNATVRNYGTARAAAAGDKVTAPPVTVNVDQRKEIVEEVNKGDMDAFGVNNLIRRRAINHVESMTTELETAFFATAADAAAAVDLTGITDVAEQLEKAIQTLETVKNDYVTGVPRSMISVVGAPSWYGSIRNKLDALPNANVDTAAEEFGLFHGVRVYPSIHLPSGIDALIMINGSVALPVVTYPYSDAEKIPLSNDFAVSMFFNYGKKALTSDLIFKITSPASTLEELDVTTEAGTETIGDTVVTVDPAAAGSGFKYVYKKGTVYYTFAYNEDLSTWTDLAAGGLVAAGTSTKITVAKVTTAGLARGRGIAVIVKKTE